MIVGSVERELVQSARSGNTGAFEDLLRPLIAPACRLAYSLLHDWEEAEDVVQESALKAWRALPRLRAQTTSLRPWFLAIVANQARSVRRRRAFSTITIGDLTWQSNREAVNQNPERVLDIHRAVAALNDGQRTLLFLHFCLDLPLNETAQVLGISAVAAKSKLYRALRSIRPALDVIEA